MKDFIDEKNYWVSSEGFLGLSFSFKTLDLEIEENLESLFDSFLKSLSQNIRVRFSLFSEFSNKISFENKRSKEIEKIGFLKNFGLIHFEQVNKISFKEAFKKDLLKKDISLQKRKADILESLDESFLDKIKAKPLDSKLFKDLYNLHKPVSFTPYGLQNNKYHIGILKLKNSGNYPLTLKSLALMLEQVPKPISFHMAFQKLSQAQADKTLKMKSREEEEGRGQVSYEKYQKAQKAISEVELGGLELFNYEIHIMFKRFLDSSLRRDLALALKALSPLGEWSLESFGAYPSLFALSPGGKLHYRLIENSAVLKCFLPCLSFGSSFSSDFSSSFSPSLSLNSDSAEKSNQNGSLIYHRRDFSLDRLNPFCLDYANHTGVIIGKSGKGKSVFANLLTSSLFQDDKTFIFLVDVKGSHKKMVDDLGGKTYKIDINNSSGLNPLSKLTTKKESIEITSHFIEKLLLEDEEESLNSEEKNQLEKNLISFVKKIKEKVFHNKAFQDKNNDLNPSLDSFYKSFKHPRKEKLSRFIKGSLNENLFKDYGETLDNRLLYFNFENISTAGNSYIAKAVMAGLMSEFSFRLLNKKPNEKLIFIADETPFFIKSCFNTFSLLSKNVRKLNGSLILLAQNSKDLILNGDTSLIDNSEFKVLFSIDGAEKEFMQTFNLLDEEFLSLKSLKTIKGLYSQFLLKDSLSSKVGFLRLSKKEYVLSNTEPDFLYKLKSIQKLLGINENKALEVMSYV
ncbi:MAG: hypothetical protein OXN83_03650 [Oligoflexia bacterium]|nr:hypothetical protein [Oligoflexia bacterium]